MCLDTRRPMSTKLKYKYKVKDDSIFRKIIKFKDKESLKLARLSLSNVGLTVSEHAFRRMRIKGYKQLLIK